MQSVANILDPAYGGVGDGVTDDTAAYNLAKATGKPVYFPKTSANIYSLGQIGVNEGLYGDPGAETKIRANTSASNFVSLDQANGVIANLTVDGNNLATSYVIEVQEGNCQITNCNVLDGGSNNAS